MLINLFMPLVLLVTLQYFVFFSDGDKSDKIANSGTILLAALAYMNFFRSSIPVNPNFTLGDSYALSVLLTVLWTVIDAFAFPLAEGQEYTRNIAIAHYTLIGIVSLFPAYVLIRTLCLYYKYRQHAKQIQKDAKKEKKKSSKEMNVSEWATNKVKNEHLAKFTATRLQNNNYNT
jgi:hypothetical protein